MADIDELNITFLSCCYVKGSSLTFACQSPKACTETVSQNQKES